MRKMEKFCGVQVLSYCLMSNHFHILVRIPPKPKQMLDDEAFLDAIGGLFSDVVVKEARSYIAKARDIGGDEKTQKDLEDIEDGADESPGLIVESVAELLR